MISKPFDRIEKSDIDSLVANVVKERRTLEFKQSLPGGKDSEKKEFLADVSSFANAFGGDLIFGIVEERDGSGATTGAPDSAPGLSGLNADAEIRRMESMIRDGIRPRISGIHIQAIEGFPSGPVLLMRIAKSYAAPHMVTFQDHSRFYTRNNAGKYALDVGEIRSAFALSESLPEKIRNFRNERLARIIADETPFKLLPSSEHLRFVLHLIPVASLDPTSRVDLAALEQHQAKMIPMSAGRCDFRFNFDGAATHLSADPMECWSYMQVFRSGIVECVEGGNVQRAALVQRPFLNFNSIEQMYIECLESCCKLFGLVRIETPVFALLSILGARGYGIATGGIQRFPKQIDRDDLLLPDVMIEDYAVVPATVLRPAFDAVWQAAGFARSLSYDPSGKWNVLQSARHY
jgi:hypothetical protein